MLHALEHSHTLQFENEDIHLSVEELLLSPLSTWPLQVSRKLQVSLGTNL